MLRNLFSFYVVILVPLAVLFLLNKEHVIEGWLLAGLLLFYAIVYRSYTDGKRLVSKHIITHNEIWKLIIPGMRIRYFKELYLS